MDCSAIKNSCYSLYSSNGARLSTFIGASAVLAVTLAITALSLSHTIPFQCLYGGGGLLILDIALTSILLSRGQKKQIPDQSTPHQRPDIISNWPEGFPIELWAKVFEHLDLVTLLKICEVCSEWKALANAPYVVKHALAKEDWHVENPDLQKAARIIYGLKREISPTLREINADLEFITSRLFLTSSQNTLLFRTWSDLYFVKFDLDTNQYLGERLKKYYDNDVITCYGSTAYFSNSNSHINIWELGLAQSMSQRKLCDGKILALCATKFKLVALVENQGLKVFSRDNLALQHSLDFATCPKLSISKGRSIYAYKEKIYFRDASHTKIMELDLETGKIQEIYKQRSGPFNLFTSKINRFFLSNGVLLIQPSLWEQKGILRYSIDAKKWLPELPDLNLKGAFCGMIVDTDYRGSGNRVWDFTS